MGKKYLGTISDPKDLVTKEYVDAHAGGSAEELTQAEYDALSQAEKENGTIYFVTDGASPATPADYVVEQGTSGIWTYRKWNSGVYEADGYYAATGLDITSSSAGTYYGGSKTIALPSFHQSLIACTNGASSPTSSGVYIYRSFESNGNLTVEYRAHTSSSNSTCGTYLHIAGRWA